MRLSLRFSILSTIAYADIFSYPLKEQELWKYLIGTTTTLGAFRKTLATLTRAREIGFRDGYYCIPNRVQCVFDRRKRHKASRNKFIKARMAVSLLSYIPSVWLIGVSGSLAMNNARPGDDIDLFIITAPHTLWLTRFFANVILDIVHIRRKPNAKRVSDTVCLNMFYDSAVLALPSSERDIFSAHEIVQLIPMHEKYHTYGRFMRANAWVKKFLPHAYIHSRTQLTRPAFQWYSRLWACERLFRSIELWYMKNKRTGEVIRGTMLRFHPVDAREWIKEAFRSRLVKYNLPLDKIFYAR